MVSNAGRRVRIVMQARSSSSRLPGKSLMAIGGVPLAVLAAKRAMRDGSDLILATSSDSTDDRLASLAAEQGLKVVRGPLDDVLARFALATADLAGDDLCIRLTGDNPVPDSDLLRDLVALFEGAGGCYFGFSGGEGSSLPYGLSAECFTVSVLRAADAQARSGPDREHVTPWIRRAAATASEAMQVAADRLLDPPTRWSGHRCTVDTPEDYWRMTRLFAEAEDPTGIPWRTLCDRLTHIAAPRLPFRLGGGRSHAALTLGTAQFGLPYGIANDGGLPEMRKVERILGQALQAGVMAFDTAPAYGCSETRLGQVLDGDRGVRITTKLGHGVIVEGVDAPSVRSAVDAAVAASLKALRRDHVDTLLLHDPLDRTRGNGAAWTRLCELQADGTIGRLGISVYDPTTARDALDDPRVRAIQHPLNPFDPRWAFLQTRQAASGVEWHARSIFLQGLLTLDDPARWTMVPRREYAEDLIARLAAAYRETGCENVAELCIRFALSHDSLSSLVLGVAEPQQLDENISRAAMPQLSRQTAGWIRAQFSDVDASVYDPRNWSRYDHIPSLAQSRQTGGSGR